MKNYNLLLFLLCTAQSIAFSQYTFYGNVHDGDTKDPLIGANVIIVGTPAGTSTDFDGNFKLPSADSILTLEFSYTGFKTVIQTFTASKKIIQPMEPNSLLMDEVVITSSQPRRRVQDASSSVSIISPRRGNRNKRKQRRTPKPITYEGATRHYPTKDENENYSTISENKFHKVLDEPLSTFSIDVDAASYSNLRRFINSGQQPPKDAIRIEEMINYFNYDYPTPKGKHPFEVITEVGTCPWNAQHRLVHIGLQGKKIATDKLPPSNLVFLIDVSGSMNDRNKLPLLQSSIKLLVNQLRPADKVAMVVYAGAAGVVLPATAGSDRQKIIDALDKLRAGGSTAGAAGIQLAYKIAKENFVKKGNNRVIIATDGDFNVGQTSEEGLVKLIENERKSGVFLTVLGFGTGNYQDHKMQELADRGNGNHAYIDNILEAKKVLVQEFGGTLFTIAKDVKLQIEFNPAKVQNYRLIGYENRMLEAEDFNDDRKDAGELGAGHTVTALYEVIPTGVQSSFSASVDPLKYQKNTTVNEKTIIDSKELMTIKLRYKKPDGMTSRLITQPVIDAFTSIEKTSDNFKFAAAVAQFGLVLRNSDFKNLATYTKALNLAKSAKGKDENGYRAELIRLIEMMNLMNE